jgi:hypothetical protein
MFLFLATCICASLSLGTKSSNRGLPEKQRFLFSTKHVLKNRLTIKIVFHNLREQKRLTPSTSAHTGAASFRAKRRLQKTYDSSNNITHQGNAGENKNLCLSRNTSQQTTQISKSFSTTSENRNGQSPSHTGAASFRAKRALQKKDDSSNHIAHQGNAREKKNLCLAPTRSHQTT